MEVKADKGDELKPGDKVLCDSFAEQDHVDVIGTSKGKGFMGVVARHGFRGGAATHGSMFHRAPGSIGPSAFPSRVYPGTRSSGRLGGRQSTSKNLVVVRVDAEKNLLYISRRRPGRPERDRQDRALELRPEEGVSSMAKIAVLNWKNEQVGEVALPDGRLRVPVPPAPRVGGRQGLPRGPARRHAQDEGPLRGLGLRQEALQAEGDRPGPAGRRPPADPPPRRHGRTGPCRARTRRDVSVGEKKNALKAVLSRRAAEERIVVVDKLDVGEPQDQGPRHGAVGGLGIEGKALFVDARGNENFIARLAQREGLEARRPARRQRVRRARPRDARAVEAGVLARRQEPGRRVMDAAADHPAAR